MPISGCKGGAYRAASDAQGFDIDAVRYWHAVGHHSISGSILFHKLARLSKPMQLEVGIGNTCGLQCQHCFLGYPSGAMHRKLTPLSQLISATTTMVENLGTRVICVSDRDALTPRRSIPYFRHLATLRKTYPTLKFGGITNGLTLHHYINELEVIKLDYLDISIDGPQYEHEQFRGIGKFDCVLANLRLALQHQVASRIMVATTLTRLNEDATIRLITQLILEEGVEWFDISPLMAVRMQKYQLHADDLAEFLDSLTRTLAPLHPLKAVNILLEVPAYAASFLPSLIRKGWLNPEKIRQDSYGHLYQDIVVNNGITITLRPELIPEYWRHTIRISADGFVVGGCETLTQADYTQFAIGNIQSESIADIYARALELDSPFHQMMLAYDQSHCRQKTCFAQCLGGDSLLSRTVYQSYTQKDPNCIWEEYPVTRIPSTQGVPAKVKH